MNRDTPSMNAGYLFPSTDWMLISAVQDRSHPECQPALDRFARLYWEPAYRFLRTSGCPEQEAEDIAQEFFTRLLDSNWIQKARPQRGPFRAYLRELLRNVLADQTSPRRLPRQKLFERRQLSLETLASKGERCYEPLAGETPDQAFDRAFARSVIQAVWQELKENCETEGREDWYKVFTATYPEDIWTEPPSQQAVAEKFGMSRDQVRYILDRMKDRCRRLLCNELRDYGGNENDDGAEGDELLRLVSHHHPHPTLVEIREDADESIRRLYLRLGLVSTDPRSSPHVNWNEFERLLFGAEEEDRRRAAPLRSFLSASRQEGPIAPPPARVTLTLASGPDTGRQFVFEERTTCIIGRDKECLPGFPRDKKHQALSRHHCLLDIKLPDVSIRDLGSKCGTYLNGTLIGKRPETMTAEEGRCLVFKDHPLRDGDEIKLGEKGVAVFRVNIFQPTLCLDCGAWIADEQRDRCEQKPGVYQCDTCREKVVVADHPKPLRRCAQCGKDVATEDGANRPGAFVCHACRQQPDQLLQNYQSQARARVGGVPILHGYTIQRKLGEGSMGQVWLARSEGSTQDVAVKLLIPEMAADDRAVSWFLKEMTHTSRLHHTNVVRLHKFDYTSGTIFMVLEYCDGGSVAHLMQQRGGSLPLDEAVEITLQALEGLHYAHNLFGSGKGLVHRDLKPANLFLSGQGSARIAKVGDYGLAKALDEASLSSSTRAGEAAGTPYFMARQQVIDFKCAQPEVDVWAMAASLYNMLTGAVPRDFAKGGDPWLTVLEAPPVPILLRKPSLSKELAAVIDLALVEEPEIPFKTAMDFKEALESAL